MQMALSSKSLGASAYRWHESTKSQCASEFRWLESAKSVLAPASGDLKEQNHCGNLLSMCRQPADGLKVQNHNVDEK